MLFAKCAHMKKLILFLLPIFLISATPDSRPKDELAERLIGTWVHKQDLDKNSYRFVRADSFKKNTKGFTFQKDGKLVMYVPFGCQLPPNFNAFGAEWKVLNKNTLEIDRHYPGEEPDKMKITKLNDRVLRFVWK